MVFDGEPAELAIKDFRSPNTRHAGFAFPMMLESSAPMTRAQLCAELESVYQTRLFPDLAIH